MGVMPPTSTPRCGFSAANDGTRNGYNGTGANRPAWSANDRGRCESGDLHHRSYDRFGVEAFTDLLPLCRDCHTRLHDLWDCSPDWRKLGRSQATIGIIHALRRACTVPRP